MYRDQLYCILTPPDARDVAALETLVANSGGPLRQALLDVGEVHYASLFVLPPAPGDQRRVPAVVVGLELVVDEGATMDALLDRLVDGAIDCLWPIYAPHADPADLGIAERKRWLAAFLRGRVRKADGGYVGARDITVAEVREEAALYQALRREARLLAPHGFERPLLASRLIGLPVAPPAPPGVRAAADSPQLIAMRQQAEHAATRAQRFPWASKPAEPNEWCVEGLGPIRRSARIAARSLGGVWVLVALVILVSLFAIVGSLFALAAATVLSPGAVVHALGAYGASARGATIAIVIVWAAGALLIAIAVDLWMRNVATDLVVAVVIPALIVFVVITLAVAAQLLVQHVGGTALFTGRLAPLQEVAPVAAVLVGWGLGVLGAAVLVGLAVVLAFVAALLLVPPDRGTRAVVSTFALFAFGSFALGQIALFGILRPGVPDWFDALSSDAGVRNALPAPLDGWIADAGLRVAAVLRRDAICVLMPFFGALVVFVLYCFFRTMMRIAALSRRPADDGIEAELVRSHQVHPSIVASEASLAMRCNHMISLTELRRPVWWWSGTTLLALRTVGRLADTWFVRGALGNANGIHFAHWYLVDEGRRLLFLSNYDGDFSGYLDEFIHGATEGVNLIWRGSHLVPRRAAAKDHPSIRHPRRFPPVRRFVLGGCVREQWFKAYVRDSMLPHLFRFEAYNESLQNILAARRLRNARCGPRSAIKDDAIMRVLER